MKLPQLSLRDLFWVLVVMACLCGWFASDYRINEARVRAEQTLSVLEERLEAVENVGLSEDLIHPHHGLVPSKRATR